MVAVGEVRGPFRAAVPFWGKTTQIMSSLSNGTAVLNELNRLKIYIYDREMAERPYNIIYLV